jgi:S-formylglutathione hydrolase FrmB
MQQSQIQSSILLLALTALSAGISCIPVDAQRRRSSWRDRTALKNIVFKSDQEFATKAARRGVYSIYLPKDYDDEKNAQKRYPVIYFLHGLNEDHNRFNTRGGAGVLDKVIGEKGIPQLIFVCVYDGSRRSFYMDSRRAKVETMIVKDLITHVDKKYRTIADRSSRALMGVSMGGFGALKIAFKNTAMFGSVATHSAAILPVKYDDLDEMFPWATQRGFAASIFGDPVDEKMWAANNPLAIAHNMAAEKLKSLKIYFDCGDRDRYSLDKTNVRMHEVLTKRKIPHVWKLVKGGNHGWNTRGSSVGYNTANLPNSLRFIGKAWAVRTGGKPPTSRPKK